MMISQYQATFELNWNFTLRRVPIITTNHFVIVKFSELVTRNSPTFNSTLALFPLLNV